jgi:hypothetical protein
MQSPTDLNEHNIWGEQRARSIQDEHFPDYHRDEDGQTTFIVRQVHTGQQDHQFRSSSQAGFIATYSDDLFHPTSGGPTSPVFNLPDVPFNPNPQYLAYNRRANTYPGHFPNLSSSYNNPTFNPNMLGPPPPIPFRTRPIHNHSVHNQFPPFYPAYIQPPTPQLLNNSPSPLSSLPPLPKTLPTVTHIPLLTSKIDFFAWDEGVTSLIRANGLIGHILDPSEPVDLNRLDRTPAPIPSLPTPPSLQDILTLNRWWDEDNIAQHILVSRLGSIPRGLLPSPNLATRTALSIYKMLLLYYGTCNFADCLDLMNSLYNTPCTAG